MTNETKELNIKLILIGDSDVGKTTLLYKYINESIDDISPTVGLENKSKTIEIKGFTTKIKLWDTAGQEKFNYLTQQFFKNTEGVLIVFDLTNKNSFNHIKKWIDGVGKNSDRKIKRIIVGNKCDLKDSIQVTKEDINREIIQKKLKYIEVSAMDGTNVDKAFDILINSIVGKRNNEELIADFGMNDQILSLSGSTLNNLTGEKQKKCCK